MYDLPYATHRYIVGHLAGEHLKTKLIRNYLGFIKRIKESPKFVLRQLFNLASSDVGSVTGCNLRNILLMTNLTKVKDLNPAVINKIQIPNEIKEDQMWRISLVKEITDIRYSNVCAPDGWTDSELQEILTFCCAE